MMAIKRQRGLVDADTFAWRIPRTRMRSSKISRVEETSKADDVPHDT